MQRRPESGLHGRCVCVHLRLLRVTAALARPELCSWLRFGPHHELHGRNQDQVRSVPHGSFLGPLMFDCRYSEGFGVFPKISWLSIPNCLLGIMYYSVLAVFGKNQMGFEWNFGKLRCYFSYVRQYEGCVDCCFARFSWAVLLCVFRLRDVLHDREYLRGLHRYLRSKFREFCGFRCQASVHEAGPEGETRSEEETGKEGQLSCLYVVSFLM